MGALLDQFRTRGIVLEPTDEGNVRARGALTDALRAAIRANKPAILAELAANEPCDIHYRWRVTFPDRVIEACFLPELSWRDVRARYPGALVEPLDEATKQGLDADYIRRREKALAMLQAHPNLRVAVVAQRPDCGSPMALVCVAVRGAAVTDLEIPA